MDPNSSRGAHEWTIVVLIALKLGVVSSKEAIRDPGMDLTEAEDIKKRWQIHRRTVQKTSSQPR